MMPILIITDSPVLALVLFLFLALASLLPFSARPGRPVGTLHHPGTAAAARQTVVFPPSSLLYAAKRDHWEQVRLADAE
jgi:hypothetical protein